MRLRISRPRFAEGSADGNRPRDRSTWPGTCYSRIIDSFLCTIILLGFRQIRRRFYHELFQGLLKVVSDDFIIIDNRDLRRYDFNGLSPLHTSRHAQVSQTLYVLNSMFSCCVSRRSSGKREFSVDKFSLTPFRQHRPWQCLHNPRGTTKIRESILSFARAYISTRERKFYIYLESPRIEKFASPNDRARQITHGREEEIFHKSRFPPLFRTIVCNLPRQLTRVRGVCDNINARFAPFLAFVGDNSLVRCEAEFDERAFSISWDLLGS